MGGDCHATIVSRYAVDRQIGIAAVQQLGLAHKRAG
jgi:hypothetical protein